MTKLRLRVGAVAVTAAVLTVGLAATVASPASADPSDFRGTWVLQEASSVKQLNHHAPAIRRALSWNGVVGLSIRVPWSTIEPRKNVYNFKVLKRAREIAGSKKLSVRFMAGRNTPRSRMGHTMVYNGSLTGGMGKGSVVPLPFGRDGGPNAPFERGWKKVVDKLVHWCKNHRVRLLHMSWPGLLWSEIAVFDQLKKQPGYSLKATQNTHVRMMAYAMKKSSRRFYVEFASSGYGVGEVWTPVWQYLMSKPAHRRVFINSNYISSTSTNVPDDDPPPPRGAQMVGPGNRFDWDRVYNNVRRMYGVYLEVYTPSFSGGTSRQLKREAARFG
jgi:hypothetical protein